MGARLAKHVRGREISRRIEAGEPAESGDVGDDEARRGDASNS